MNDDSISPESGSDLQSENVELPVNLDTLSIDGTVPSVGDPVKLIVKGNVTRVVNKCAYVKPETINDQPMEPAIEPNPLKDEDSRLEEMSRQAGGIPGYA